MLVAVSMGVLWAAYTIGIWGYCLVRGYDVPLSGLFSQKAWPGGGASSSGAAPLPPSSPGTGTFTLLWAA